MFPVDQIPILAGPGQGVRMIKISTGSRVVGLELINVVDSLQIQSKGGKEQTLQPDEIPRANRSTQGKKVSESIVAIKRLNRYEGCVV
jgi:DNA gyrase/topoisomerase IV subunit A